MTSRTIRSFVVAAGAAGMLVASSGAARAGGFEEDGALVARASTVVVTAGKGDPISSGTYTVPVPPKCWWEPIPLNFDLQDDFDASDPEQFQEWWDETVVQMRGHAAAGYFALPPREEVRRIVKLEQQGADYTWYSLGAQDGVNCADEGFTTSHGTVGDAYGGQGAGEAANDNIPVSYAAFPAHQPPPAPLVDVADLSERLWDEVSQQIEDPMVDRNPTINNLGGATLVNLATWFWVDNVEGALAEDGNIHLEAHIPGSPVRTTIDVGTTGVDITSPAGATSCAIDQAKTSYAPGASDGDACTVAFAKGNRAGWPVTSSIVWTGGWEGVQANGETESGDLSVSRSSTTDVPVSESQALVRQVS